MSSDHAQDALEPHYKGIPPDALSKVDRQPIVVVLDNIRSAFNVGSIFRTSDAGGVSRIDLCGMTAYPPHPRLDRTALGATDYVEWEYHEKTETAIARLRKEGLPVIAIEVTDTAASHVEFAWPSPVAVVFGNEVTGISPDLIAQCDAAVCIPMHGYKNSINVATAFGIVLYEILRQWSG